VRECPPTSSRNNVPAGTVPSRKKYSRGSKQQREQPEEKEKERGKKAW
jgi:hypothetical protein